MARPIENLLQMVFLCIKTWFTRICGSMPNLAGGFVHSGGVCRRVGGADLVRSLLDFGAD